jgi:hypothetical protein
MSTLQEIEAAIEKLPPEQWLEIAAWLDEQRAMVQSSEGMFAELDAVERRNGFDVLPQRGTAMATVEDVRRSCAEEGI